MSKQTITSWAIDPANKTDVLRAVDVVRGDGWTIFAPEAFDMIPPEVLKMYTHKQASDNTSYKTQITRPDGSIGDVFGVYGLDVLEGIAGALGIDSWKSGRGSRAMDLTGQIRQKLGA